MSRLHKTSVLAWPVLLVFEWPEEIIWKVADTFGKEGKWEKIEEDIEEDINRSAGPRK